MREGVTEKGLTKGNTVMRVATGAPLDKRIPWRKMAVGDIHVCFDGHLPVKAAFWCPLCVKQAIELNLDVSLSGVLETLPVFTLVAEDGLLATFEQNIGCFKGCMTIFAIDNGEVIRGGFTKKHQKTMP